MVRDLIGLQVRTHLALRYQSGRCNEYAYVALQCLYMMRNKLGDNFEKVVKDMRVVVSGDPENHVFVEMDIKEGNNKTTTIVCDPWAGYAGKLEDIPEQFNVCGRPAKEIYQSQNKTDLLNNDFIEFAFKHQSSFDNNVTNFNLYHGSVYKNNDKQPYCKYLKSLPDEPSIDYQEAMDYKSELFTDPEDYKDSSQRVYKALDSLDFKNDVPPAMKVNKGIYYSQPDLQGLSLEPANKSINNDMDDMVLSNASNQTTHKDDNQNAKKDVNQAIQNDSSQELKQNSIDNNNNESTAQSSPLLSNSSQ